MIKTPKDIEHLRRAGKILSTVLDRVAQAVRPGVTTRALDDLAERLILENGCVPSFKGHVSGHGEPPFPTTLCTSVNEQVVHTPASDYVLKAGDIIGVDIGLKLNADCHDYYVDMAKTYPVGKVSADAKKLIRVTRESLECGLAQVAPGKTIADIGRAIQPFVESFGYSVVRALVGHGVGYEVHEEPRIPNYYDENMDEVVIQEGMVLAIEPMVNIGKSKIRVKNDGWTIETADGSLSAHFEHTIAVTKQGCEILTR